MNILKRLDRVSISIIAIMIIFLGRCSYERLVVVPPQDIHEKVYSQIFLRYPDAHPVTVKVNPNRFALPSVNIEVCVREHRQEICSAFNEFPINEFGYLDELEVSQIYEGVEASKMGQSLSADSRYFLLDHSL